MPEYLSPGVYIEEVPPQLRAIEGVSTSTAGFVGAAARGPVPGFSLPFTPVAADPMAVLVPRDSAPVLVTSLADYTRTFGPLPSAPSTLDRNFLGHAVRAFFDNGGKRAYVARVVSTNGSTHAARASGVLGQGAASRLKVKAKAGQSVLTLDSLRNVNNGDTVTITSLSGATETPNVASYDTQSNQITLSAALTNDYGVDDTFVVVGSTAPSKINGARFWARSPGSWGSSLQVTIFNSERAPTKIVALASTPVLTVQTTASFYVGAILEVDDGTNRTYHTVVEVLSGTRVRVDDTVTVTSVTSAFARVVEIDVVVVDTGSGKTEVFKGLTWGVAGAGVWPIVQTSVQSRHYANVINTQSTLVYVQPPGVGGLGGTETYGPNAQLSMQPQSFQTVGALTAFSFPETLAGGVDGSGLTDPDFVGIDNGPGDRSGIQSLQDVETISIIACPGETAVDIQNELITQCENLRYRFAVLDGQQGPPSDVTAILAHRNNYASSYAAYYVPWVQVDNGITTIELPPSGYAMGIYARVDNDRGVWKAPANEPVRNITGLHSYVTTGEQDILNPAGVDCIRRFPGRGTLVWGARTLSADPQYKYVNVRRFLIFLEASLDHGTQWVVFEPNSQPTWSRVVDSVKAFLDTQWRAGALFGSKPEEAYYVRCDETTMSVDDVQNGRLICDIGVAIVRPAEFVIFRIEQITGFATKT